MLNLVWFCRRFRGMTAATSATFLRRSFAEKFMYLRHVHHLTAYQKFAA